MHPVTEHASRTADLVDLLDVAAVGTAEAALVNDGAPVPLTVHLISWRTESPYVGYVMWCRER